MGNCAGFCVSAGEEPKKVTSDAVRNVLGEKENLMHEIECYNSDKNGRKSDGSNGRGSIAGARKL